MTDPAFIQLICHYSDPFRVGRHLLRQLDQRSVGDSYLGLGLRFSHLSRHCCLFGRDLRCVPDRRRGVLLECHALHQEVGAIDILGHWLADVGRQLDGDDIEWVQFIVCGIE